MRIVRVTLISATLICIQYAQEACLDKYTVPANIKQAEVSMPWPRWALLLVTPSPWPAAWACCCSTLPSTGCWCGTSRRCGRASTGCPSRPTSSSPPTTGWEVTPLPSPLRRIFRWIQLSLKSFLTLNRAMDTVKGKFTLYEDWHTHIYFHSPHLTCWKLDLPEEILRWVNLHIWPSVKSTDAIFRLILWKLWDWGKEKSVFKLNSNFLSLFSTSRKKSWIAAI